MLRETPIEDLHECIHVSFTEALVRDLFAKAVENELLDKMTQECFACEFREISTDFSIFGISSLAKLRGVCLIVLIKHKELLLAEDAVLTEEH